MCILTVPPQGAAQGAAVRAVRALCLGLDCWCHCKLSLQVQLKALLFEWRALGSWPAGACRMPLWCCRCGCAFEALAGAAAGCRCRVCALELACWCCCRVWVQGTTVKGLSVSLELGCCYRVCCQSAVCAMKLGRRCRCRGWLRDVYGSVGIGP